MDRRSLFAILMTIAVLFAWNYFYIAPKQKALRQQRMIEFRDKAIADSLAALERSTWEGEAPAESEEIGGDVAPREREITTPAAAAAEQLSLTVVTEKMKVGLSSMGGEVRSVELLDFARKAGGLVELVPEGAEGGFALSMIEGDRRTPLSRTPFETIVNGRPVSEDTEIVLGEQLESATVTFRWAGENGEYVEKRFEFVRGGYEVRLGIVLKREGSLKDADSYSVSWECGMAVTEKDERADRRQFASMGKVGEEFYKKSAGKFGKTSRMEHDGMIVWAGSRSKYFLSALIPERQRAGTLSMLGDKSEGFVGYEIGYEFRGNPREIDDSYICYLGPLDMKGLKAYGLGLEKTIDLGALRFFSIFILRLMVFLRRFIPNYGVIIILLSFLTKVLFYRLTHKSMKSMKDMQKLQPRLKELQEKHKDDREKLNKQMTKLYKEAGVNPLGGCLPLLLQMPVFYALFRVLSNTIELRGASFVLWINDLSSPDVLFKIGAKLPFLGNEFHLLPILMGVGMYAQSKLGGSPTGGETPAMQTKMMSTMMPIILTVFFYGMPSGLVLYWTINTVMSIIQQYYIHTGADDEEEVSGSQEPPEAKPDAGKSAAADDGREGESRRAASKKGGKARRRKSKRGTYH